MSAAYRTTYRFRQRFVFTNRLRIAAPIFAVVPTARPLGRVAPPGIEVQAQRLLYSERTFDSCRRVPGTAGASLLLVPSSEKLD